MSSDEDRLFAFSSSERNSVALRLRVVTSSVRISDTIVSLKGKGKLMADHTDYRAEVAEFYDHIVQYREREDVDFFVDKARESGGRSSMGLRHRPSAHSDSQGTNRDRRT